MTDAKAVICTAPGKVGVQTMPRPTLQPGQVIIRTKAVALNPTDWKSIHAPNGATVGKRPGMDFAGVIEDVGPDATYSWAKGQEVFGLSFGAQDAERGAFGEYVVANEHNLMSIPKHMGFVEAATLGVGMFTTGQALYQLFGLPLPTATSTAGHEQHTILIGGGSTATAVVGIQYAKLSGLRVLATASPYNFDYLRSLGVDTLLDYHDNEDDLVSKIKEATGGNLTLAWDCAPDEKSRRVAALSMSTSQKGIYVNVNPLTPADHLHDINPLVETKYQLGYTFFGQEFDFFGHIFPASEEDVQFAQEFGKLSAQLLEQAKIQPTRATVNRGGPGLEGVVVGLDELSQGKVAGSKLVYTL